MLALPGVNLARITRAWLDLPKFPPMDCIVASKVDDWAAG